MWRAYNDRYGELSVSSGRALTVTEELHVHLRMVLVLLTPLDLLPLYCAAVAQKPGRVAKMQGWLYGKYSGCEYVTERAPFLALLSAAL